MADERTRLALIAARHAELEPYAVGLGMGQICEDLGFALSELAALRARAEAAERERDEWARRAVGADHDRAGEYAERVAAEEDRDCWRVRADRLAEAFRRHRTATHVVASKHCETCQESDAALAEHEALRGMT